MIAREGQLILPPPGGDVIGRRRVDTHLLALRKLGAEMHFDESFHFKCKGLFGTDILLMKPALPRQKILSWLL